MDKLENNKRSLCMFGLLLCALLIGTHCTNSENSKRQSESAIGTTTVIAGYDTAYIGLPLADPVMQKNKEAYVIFGCAYCHGIDLVPVGEATDLRTSLIVAADENANVMGPVLRAGIPQTPKSSPMPQYSDLSEQEIQAVASYIHYARAKSRFESLINEPASAGDAAAGKSYFEMNCASCHAEQNDLAGIKNKYDALELRKQVLEPTIFKHESRQDTELIEGRSKHQKLLENHIESNVANIVAYLQTL